MDRQEAVLHLRDRGLPARDLVHHRVVLVPLDEPADHPVECGREQQGLVVPIDTPQDPLDLGHEAHVGHAVRLVEHQSSDAREVNVFLSHQVQQTTGCGNEYVDALAEFSDLWILVDPTKDDRISYVRVTAELGELAMNLQRQFAGRRQNQRTGYSGLRSNMLFVETLQQR